MPYSSANAGCSPSWARNPPGIHPPVGMPAARAATSAARSAPVGPPEITRSNIRHSPLVTPPDDEEVREDGRARNKHAEQNPAEARQPLLLTEELFETKDDRDRRH